jgi:hypothetical protein
LGWARAAVTGGTAQFLAVRHHSHVMKKPAIIFVGLLGILLASAVLFWRTRTVSVHHQGQHYDPVKNVTTITKDGFTWYVTGNIATNMGTITNPAALTNSAP